MSLAKKFDHKLKNTLGLHSAWPPGSAIDIGDIMVKGDGLHTQIGNLTDFGVTFNTVPENGIEVIFESQYVEVETMQGGANVGLLDIVPGIEAEAEIQFKKQETYFFRTPKLKGVSIDNLSAVADQIVDIKDWKHQQYFIAWKVMTADGFTFLGSKQSQKKVKYAGSGDAIVKFIKIGVNAGISKTVDTGVSLQIVGEQGPVAVGYVRVKSNGLFSIV